MGRCGDCSHSCRQDFECYDCEDRKVRISVLEDDLREAQQLSGFRDKVADLLGCQLIESGKEYLLLYRLEDILKDYRQLKDKGVASVSESIASERTPPDDRNCGSAG